MWANHEPDNSGLNTKSTQFKWVATTGAKQRFLATLFIFAMTFKIGALHYIKR